MSRVAVVRCSRYSPDIVYAAVNRAVSLVGGVGAFVAPGERVVLKPNVLAGEPPEKAVTTHPCVVYAAARLFLSHGAAVSYGDSPGIESYHRALRRAGLVEAMEGLGAVPGDFGAAEQLSYHPGRFVTRFPIAKGVADADAVVGLPKLKTHGLTRITGAVKNNLGCVHGLAKARYHLVCPDSRDFSDLLVDLTKLVKPRLYIADGVVAMEGNGPRGGDPARIRVILASSDPVALDATFCRLVDLDPAYVPTNVAGYDARLGVYQDEEVEVVGDALSALRVPSFQVVRQGVNGHDVAKNLPFLKGLLLDRPVIDERRCVRCGACVTACPVPEKAVGFVGGDRSVPPRYDYARCIRCYCCQEMCPHRAIHLRTPLVGRLLRRDR